MCRKNGVLFILMKRITYALLTLAALTSCANSYNIHGSSNVQMLDGHMLYLKVYNNNSLKDVDSCDVVHGQFHFTGTVDSTRMATLCIDNEGILPIVIESGDINVRIDNMQQRVSGTPLNDKLSDFMEKYAKLQDQIADLPHKESQAIMDGEDETVTRQRLNQEYAEIVSNTDQLVTSFIEENFDNALGPGVFFMMTAGFPHPVLQPWIEALMTKASDNFKNDAYVRDYYSKAKENEAIANGTADQNMMLPAEPAKAALPQAPTPAELAAPTGTDSLSSVE